MSLTTCGLEGVSSGYWTRLVNPVSGHSATAVQLCRPPTAALTKVTLDSQGSWREHVVDKPDSTTGFAKKPRSDDPGFSLSVH